jgi:hypothetical protein
MAVEKINTSNTNPAAPAGRINVAWQISAPYTDPLDTASQVSDLSASIALVNFSDAEVPSGTINGSNVTFTLAHTPSPAASLQLFNGIVQKAGGIDFTLSGATITFTTAPSSGSVLQAWYRY